MKGDIKTVLRNNKSRWKEVTNEVSQGSVLSQIVFALYINDMAEGVTGCMNMFADGARNAKIMRQWLMRETVQP